jgi:hypothetical protein
MGDDTPPTPVLASVTAGRFQPIAPYTGLTGEAVLARKLDGTTEVSLSLAGVTPSTGFAAHVHNQPCAYQGGGHYKIDPLVLEAVETNELWLVPTSGTSGVANAKGTFPHLARGEALSVVVHDAAMGNAKMACADLFTDDGATSIASAGTFAPFLPADPLDANLTGSVDAMRSQTATTYNVTFGGLDPLSQYSSHLHAEPCEVDKGAGHYKLDPSVLEVIEANEIWFLIPAEHPAGTATISITRQHAVRTDAQSIVLHRILADLTAVKVGCANLVRSTAHTDLTTTGPAIALPDGVGVTGSATMVRTLAAQTKVSLNVSGLTAGAMYKSHVHNQPCAVENGGGHYVMDPLGTVGVPENEIWLDLTAAGDGTATATVTSPALARAEAQSVVLHSAEGARMACFDLL